ncbi:toxin glutamine deamidase domain-containing protein [Gordonia iterans]|nr:toxin glutamine deamidase domain-containing protein [Gordonia iterans]
MASELQEVCTRLLDTCSTIDQRSAELRAANTQLDRALQELNRAISDSGAPVRDAVAMVADASRKARAAEGSLGAASAAGTSYARSQIGAGSGGMGGPPSRGATAGGAGVAAAGGAGTGGAVPTSGLDMEQIDGALAAINPNFDPYSFDDAFRTNCGHTSSILFDTLNGAPVRAAPGGTTLTTPQMEAATSLPQTPATPAQVEASLRAAGAGSHCVVGVDRSTGDGHWFNAYYDGQDVWVLDAQTGVRSPWPPDEPDAVVWDASLNPADVAP